MIAMSVYGRAAAGDVQTSSHVMLTKAAMTRALAAAVLLLVACKKEPAPASPPAAPFGDPGEKPYGFGSRP